MWNLFRKSDKFNNSDQMGFLQRLVMKKVMNMSEEERIKFMQKALSPENIEKNKDKILTVLNKMEKSGHLSKFQIEEIKKNLGV